LIYGEATSEPVSFQYALVVSPWLTFSAYNWGDFSVSEEANPTIDVTVYDDSTNDPIKIEYRVDSDWEWAVYSTSITTDDPVILTFHFAAFLETARTQGLHSILIRAVVKRALNTQSQM
jgi:hypothetical protein